MQGQQKITELESDVSCLVIEPTIHVPNICDDVLSGLFRKPRSLQPKYFYDERGSHLFDKICETPEYYPTRTEDLLLQKYADKIIEKTLPDNIIELGSGTSRKTRRLFDACEKISHQCSYSPFDVCEPMLIQAAMDLRSTYTWLDVSPLVGDYHAGLGNLPKTGNTNFFIFLGSTIGNFSPDEARFFIQDLRRNMSSGDYFLIGADRVKDIGILNEAYNDASNYTAEFNLNVLRVLNRELGSNFDLNRFQHKAFFNSELGRIEMHLISIESQEVSFEALQTSIQLEQGESILTEVSHKFELEEIESLVLNSGFELEQHYQADNQFFSLLLARAN